MSEQPPQGPPGTAQPHPPAVPPAQPPYPAPYGYQPYAQPYAHPQPGNGLAITGGVLGIIAVVLFWVPWVGAVLGVLAIIFSALGIQRANRLPGAPGKGFAIAGLVCGIIAVAVDIIFVLLIYAAFSTVHVG